MRWLWDCWSPSWNPKIDDEVNVTEQAEQIHSEDSKRRLRNKKGYLEQDSFRGRGFLSKVGRAYRESFHKADYW